MIHGYYRVFEDVQFPGRWHLDDPITKSGQKLQPWIFSSGNPVAIKEPIQIPLLREGRKMDFTEVAFGMPVVSGEFLKVMQETVPVDFQSIEVSIDGQEESFYILNVTTTKDCVDEAKSKFKKFQANDPVRPDRAGKYRIIEQLVVAPERILGAGLFRVKDSERDLVASEKAKAAIEHARLTGIRFVSAYPQAPAVGEIFG